MIRVSRPRLLLSLSLPWSITGQYQLWRSLDFELMISADPQLYRSCLSSAPSPSEAIWQKGHVNKAGKASTSASKGRRGFVPPAPKAQGGVLGSEIIRTVPPPTPSVCPFSHTDDWLEADLVGQADLEFEQKSPNSCFWSTSARTSAKQRFRRMCSLCDWYDWADERLLTLTLRPSAIKHEYNCHLQSRFGVLQSNVGITYKG